MASFMSKVHLSQISFDAESFKCSERSDPQISVEMNLSLPIERMVSGAAAVEFDSLPASPLPVTAADMEVTAPSAERE